MKRLLTTSAIIIALATGAAEAREGGWFGGEGHHHKHMESPLAKLPEDKAKLVRDTMKATGEQNKAKWEQVRTLREELKTIAVAPEFDKSAYLAKHAEIQKITGDMMTARNAAFADVMTQLSQEERKIVSEAFDRKFKRPGKHHHGKKPVGGPDTPPPSPKDAE